MTLICFITIFSGGGIFLLLVFLSGTAIRAYLVYILHELMSEIRKPHAFNEPNLAGVQDIQSEPRSVVEAEEGGLAVEHVGEIKAVPDEDSETPAGDEGTSSTNSLQPVGQGSQHKSSLRAVLQSFICLGYRSDLVWD